MMNNIVGDLLARSRGILVQGCNAQGKMGSGLAKAVRDQFPKAYDDYIAAHAAHGLRVGQVVFSVVRSTGSTPTLVIANAITQEFYGRDPNRRYVDYDGVQRAFEAIAHAARTWDLPVFYPLIGCGLANGQWAKVGPRIDHALAGLDHALVTPRPLEEELQLIGQARTQARSTASGYRSVEPPRSSQVSPAPSPVSASISSPPTSSTPHEPAVRRSMFPTRRGR